MSAPVDTKAEARARFQRALQLVEEAQHTLSRAAQELSSVCYAAPEQRRIMQMHDRVHRFWYQLADTRHKAKWAKLDLDGIATSGRWSAGAR